MLACVSDAHTVCWPVSRTRTRCAGLCLGRAHGADAEGGGVGSSKCARASPLSPPPSPVRPPPIPLLACSAVPSTEQGRAGTSVVVAPLRGCLRRSRL
eukprot:2668472-Rhodomonas_salina.1